MNDLPLLQAASDNVDITGSVERIVFHNEENGYTVLRLLPQDGKDVQTVVGHMLNPQAGVQLRVQGTWVNSPRFGRQIHMESSEEVLPATTEGILTSFS